MADRDQVINAFRHCEDSLPCSGCKYHEPYSWESHGCWYHMAEDAVKLLASTTRWNPVNPDRCMSSDKFECDECKGIVRFAIYQDECDYDFCPWCGRRTE